MPTIKKRKGARVVDVGRRVAACQPTERPSMTDALLAAVAEDPDALSRVAKRILTIAEAEQHPLTGKAWDTIFDRLDGKVPQRTELTGADGGPIQTEKPVEQMTDDELDDFIARSEARKGKARP